MHTFLILIPLFNIKQNRQRGGKKITDYNVTWPNQHIPLPISLLLYPELKTKNQILEENWRLTSKEWMQRSLKRTDFATTDLLKTVNDSQSNGNLPLFFFKFTLQIKTSQSDAKHLRRKICFFLFFYSQWNPGWQKKTVDFHSFLSRTASWSVGLPFFLNGLERMDRNHLSTFSMNSPLSAIIMNHARYFVKKKGRVMLTLFIGLGKLCNPSIRQNGNM